MVQRKRQDNKAKRMVWRISESAPLGEFVDPDADAAPVKVIEAPVRGSWMESSFELLNGTDISEGPDTVPDEMFDELFATDHSKPKAKRAAGD